MRAPLVVKRKITTETPFEMALVKDNSVIQTRPANATDDASIPDQVGDRRHHSAKGSAVRWDDLSFPDRARV